VGSLVRAGRTDIVNDLRQNDELERAKALKNSRWALRKNPENIGEKRQHHPANLERENRPLYRAYILKDTSRQTFQLAPVAAKSQLDDWLRWAPRSKLAPFIKLAASIRAHRRRI
jgi:transposase